MTSSSSSAESLPPSSGHSGGFLLFQFFKYTVYLLLSYNIVLFFQEDYLASAHTFKDGVSFGELVEAFSATVDTSAWVLLLLLFELETFVLDDEKIRGWVKWSLHGIRSLCYLLILYALYGYVVKLLLMLNISPYQVADACSLVNSGFAYIVSLDDYLDIDAASCVLLNGQELFRVNTLDLISTQGPMENAQRLAWADVINASAWVLVVIVLEIDVLLQLKGGLQGMVRTLSKWLKVVLYSILFAAAVYWGFDGDFLDFWDAFLWLVAFIFIELNIFQWSEELQENKAAQ
ncbi:hypothetical protein [Oceanicoccus sagamiensis]|uniref:Shikimate kinase n=1 Tax=Oceanicoccus sagamiensis TaxID=716816 RepID=A0A1X9NEW1_9GAMM|nr:hypothetical protein [Oceanicoccus sagamiensis]ARN73477.1 hypothetical protein BST96_04715 [Oceanicoccus sagamiensis]